MIAASERIGIVGVVDPDANTATTYLTNAIALADWHRILFIVLAGDLGSSATLDLIIQGATSSGGSYTSISAAHITQLTQAGTDDNKQVILEISPEYVENLGLGYTHIKGLLTVATATSDCAVVVLGIDPRFGPATDHDLTTVDEVVTFVN